jgi:hypothetical protein
MQRRSIQVLQHFEGMKIIDAVAAELTKRQKAAEV